MARKPKAPKTNYHIKDLVVVKSVDFEGVVKYEVGMITNKRYATNVTTTSYDIRTEGGSGLLYVSVDEPKGKQTIISSITKAWLDDGGTNNMWIHKRDGHTRANYSKEIQLIEDGAQKKEVSIPGAEVATPSVMKVHQFEKYNDFYFPTQGPRSF
jgi:hypothetical protein|tara:strand:- start:165 stop:629 length:465 start_codon:yes stop_codon:yes gene_type:complete